MKTYTPEAFDADTGAVYRKLIPESELIGRVLSLFGKQVARFISGAWISYDFDSYHIQGDFKQALFDSGFALLNKPGDSVTLYSDPNHLGVGPHNSWTFKEEGACCEPSLIISIKISAVVSHVDRGVVLTPLATCVEGWPTDPAVHLHFFETVVKHFKKDAPTIVQRMVEQGGELVIHWHGIHLAGIRSLEHLFEEFGRERSGVMALSRSALSPFKPQPYGPDKMYLPEHKQPALFRVWSEQLRRYLDQK